MDRAWTESLLPIKNHFLPFDMLAGAIRKLLEASPFTPFVIRMNDGRTFPVNHPDFADVSPKGSLVLVYDDEDDAPMQLSSLLIASVEPPKPAASTPTNERRE